MVIKLMCGEIITITTVIIIRILIRVIIIQRVLKGHPLVCSGGFTPPPSYNIRILLLSQGSVDRLDKTWFLPLPLCSADHWPLVVRPKASQDILPSQ